ncbi:MAG: hypothetical protein ACOX87_15280 [Chloroflexota bacterium]|jgi:hypothetical protein
MRRLGVTLIASLVMLLSVTATAIAGYDWCCGDPILEINGATVNVITEIPQDRLDDMDGPMMVYIRISKDVPVNPIVVDSLLNEEVVIERTKANWNGKSAVPVKVEAKVGSKSGEPIPVQLRVEGERVRGNLTGHGNGAAKMNFVVLPPAK